MSWAMAGLWSDGGLGGDGGADIADGAVGGRFRMDEDVSPFVGEEGGGGEAGALKLCSESLGGEDGVEPATERVMPVLGANSEPLG